MSTQESLWKLVHGLSDEERNEVDFIFRQRGPRALQSDPAKLFRALLETPKFDIERISNEWKRQFRSNPKPADGRAFADARYILNGIVLDALVKANRHFIGGDAERQLYQSEMLLEKQMFAEADQVLDMALISANHCAVPYFHNIILQKKIQLIPYLSNKVEGTTIELLSQLDNINKETDNFHTIYALNTRVGLIMYKSAILKKEAIAEEVVALLNQANQLALNPNILYSSQLYLWKSIAWLNGMLYNKQEQFIAQNKLCALLLANERNNLNTQFRVVYLTEMLDLATFGAQIHNKQVCDRMVRYVTTHAPESGPYSVLFKYYPLAIQAVANLYLGNTQQAVFEIQSLEPFIFNEIGLFPPHAIENLKLIGSKIHLSAKNYNKVDQWLSLGETTARHTRVDVQLVLKIICLCSQYEQSKISNNYKTIITNTTFNAAVYDLKSNKTLTDYNLPLKEAILSTFVGLSENTSKQYHRDSLNELREKFIKNEGEPKIKQLLQLFDIVGWINQLR